MDVLLNHWQLIVWCLAGVVLLALASRLLLKLCGVVVVPDNSVGIVTKKFVLFGKHQRLPARRHRHRFTDQPGL